MGARFSCAVGAIGASLLVSTFGASASADPAPPSRSFVEMGTSFAVGGSPSGLKAPNAEVATHGTVFEEAVTLGVSFNGFLVTRLRYGVSEVPITNGFSLESTDPNVLVQDFRVETTVRGGFGLSRLYFGIGAGYRRMGTITGRFSDQGGEGTNSLYFSLTPQGAVAGCTAGILLNHPTAVGAYALLAASVDASAMHAEYVQHFPGSPFGAADYVTTPRVQSWLGVRLEIGMDVAFPFLWQ